jgi:hypothetical protein
MVILNRNAQMKMKFTKKEKLSKVKVGCTGENDDGIT